MADPMSTGVNAFTETRHGICATEVEQPLLNKELAQAIEAVIGASSHLADVRRLAIRYAAAKTSEAIAECQFSADVDMDFDRPGHGFWQCPWCGSQNEYED